MFNNLFKPLFRLNISKFFHTWKVKKRKRIAFFCLSAIFIVLAYGSVEVCFAGDKVPELRSNTVDSWNGLIKSREIFFVPSLFDRVKARKFVNNGGTKLRDSVIKFSEFNYFSAVRTSKPISVISPTDTDSTTKDNKDNLNHKFNLFRFLVIFITSAIVGSACTIFSINYYTQR